MAQQSSIARLGGTYRTGSGYTYPWTLDGTPVARELAGRDAAALACTGARQRPDIYLARSLLDSPGHASHPNQWAGSI